MTAVATREFAAPEELAGRLFESLVAGIEVLSVYMGEKLGYYRALAEGGPQTAPALALATGTHPRYAREWLEQQATAQLIAVDDPAAAPDERRYSLPPGYEAVLVEELSPAFLAPAGRFIKVMGQAAEQLLDAYRTGGGLGWEQLGADAREAQAAFNRPFFANDLAALLAQVPDLHGLLSAKGATVAEIGCGAGHALIALATAYPGLRAEGFDLDAATVAMARAHIEAAGLANRVRVHVRDAGDPDLAGRFDLVAAFECIHDMSDPVAVLATMRRLAKPSGAVLVMDERVAEEFGAFGDLVERLCYGASIFVCLPDGLSREPSAATGTVMRPGTLRRYALEAGFMGMEVLPLEHELFRFYRLHHE